MDDAALSDKQHHHHQQQQQQQRQQNDGDDVQQPRKYSDLPHHQHHLSFVFEEDYPKLERTKPRVNLALLLKQARDNDVSENSSFIVEDSNNNTIRPKLERTKPRVNLALLLKQAHDEEQ